MIIYIKNTSQLHFRRDIALREELILFFAHLRVNHLQSLCNIISDEFEVNRGDVVCRFKDVSHSFDMCF